MTAVALLLLVGQQALGAPAATPAAGCLPGHDGFLSMRLRGSIEAEVRWQEPALACTGMSRPDGRGLRMRFAGPLGNGGELAIVFAAPELGMGASGRGVPVNVTLLDTGGERIYGTQGDSRCVFDEVEQRVINDPKLPPRSFRVSASGFCVAPARAVDGDGSVLLTRFDFAGLVTYGEDDNALSLFPGLARSEVEVIAATGTHQFQVWLAEDDRSRARGLMHVRELPPDQGMLFLFEQPRFAAFWMKDTPVSLDILFVASDGRIVNIAQDTEPFSLTPIESIAPIAGVLEIAAGSAFRLGIVPGDRIRHPAFAGGH